MKLIVARSTYNNGIGYKNNLLWKLKDDMNWFKRNTTGHVVVMGYNTYKSIGEPLSNRINIVIDKSVGNLVFFTKYKPGTTLIRVGSKEQAIKYTEFYTSRKVFVIGGSKTYNEFIDLVDEIYLTEVETNSIKADTFFNFNEEEFEEYSKPKYFKQDKHNDYAFKTIILKRKKNEELQED